MTAAWSARRLPRAVRCGLVGIVVARLAVNGGIRVVYPFVTVIAAGLGMAVEGLALLVASRALAGLAGPAMAGLTGRFGARRLMLASMLLLTVGCLMIVVPDVMPPSARTTLVCAGFVATGLARPLFDLPMQVWVSGHVRPMERGRAVGMTEAAWALSLMVTAPVAGVLIEHTGWRSPFLLVVVMAAAGALALVVTVPADVPTPPTARVVSPTAGRRPAARRVPIWMTVGVGAALAVAAAQSLMMVYGTWLTRHVGLSMSQVGVATLLIVLAELLGEGLVVAIADRVGLARTLAVALLTSTAVYAALAVVGNDVGLALLAIGAVFVVFEVTVVVLIALVSTAARDPGVRARLLGTLMAAFACGNAIGAVLGPLLFARGGIALTSLASAGAAIIAVAVLRAAGNGRFVGSARPDGPDLRHARATPAGHPDAVAPA